MGKRIFDFIASFILLLILSWLLIIVAVLVKLTSKGPILFKQRRIGVGGSEFLIYKFRTMRTDTPKDMPTHLLENPDVYITPIGKFLRRTSIDELPQFINILFGDMSFVGPRPALYNQKDLISLRKQYGIDKMMPGLTGWAQINGRDELPIPKKVEYDKYYMDNQSVLLDLKIIFITAGKVFTGLGVVEGKQH